MTPLLDTNMTGEELHLITEFDTLLQRPRTQPSGQGPLSCCSSSAKSAPSRFAGFPRGSSMPACLPLSQRHWLAQDVCWTVVSWDLCQRNFPVSSRLLYPLHLRVDVPRASRRCFEPRDFEDELDSDFFRGSLCHQVAQCAN